VNLAELLPPVDLVPAGSFLMGTPDNERSGLAKRYGGTRESYAEESPQHEVDLPAFAMMRVPVTNALYEQWVRLEGAAPPILWRDGAPPDNLRDHPVTDISWQDAAGFARWLAQLTGTPWQLPTEAQWEKAARGTDGRQFPWGNTFDPELCNVRESGHGRTTAVGMFLDGASPYGILDLAGNVWEWTRSLQAPYPYAADDGRDEVVQSQPRLSLWDRILSRLGLGSALVQVDSRRILRGGCFANPEGFARCACRFRLSPATRTPYLGFRLVYEV
jgi:toxoflavin biosynthesis protein ToxD